MKPSPSEKNNCELPPFESLSIEAQENIIGFFDELYQIDKRLNPERYSVAGSALSRGTVTESSNLKSKQE